MKDKHYDSRLRSYLHNNKPDWEIVDSNADLILCDDFEFKGSNVFYLTESQDVTLPFVYKYQHIKGILSKIKPMKNLESILLFIQDFSKFNTLLKIISQQLINQGYSNLIIPLIYPLPTEGLSIKDPADMLLRKMKLSEIIVVDNLQYASCITSIKDLYHGKTGTCISEFVAELPFHMNIYVTSFPYPILEGISIDKCIVITSDKSKNMALENLIDNQCVYLNERAAYEIDKYID